MRRGALADYDEDKMLSGEIAVTTDEDTNDQQVYVAFAPGVSKRILTDTDLQDLTATKIWTGSCGTMNSNRAKTVTLDRPSNFTLINNTTLVLVRFTFGNSQSSPTLNVSGTGAFPIRYNDGNGNVVELTDDTFYKTLGGVRLFRYTTNGTDSWWDIENITQYDAQRIRNAIEQIDQAWRNSLALAYSTSGTYAVGDYVVYNGQLYVCKTAITTAEAWTAAHWTAVTVGEELTDLKAEFSQLDL